MDQRYEHVRCRIDKVVTLRKEVAPKLYEIHEDVTNLQIKHLKNLKINLRKVEVDLKIPEETVEMDETEIKDDFEFEKKLYEQLKLLDILNSKISPIQKIIDEI